MPHRLLSLVLLVVMLVLQAAPSLALHPAPVRRNAVPPIFARHSFPLNSSDPSGLQPPRAAAVGMDPISGQALRPVGDEAARVREAAHQGFINANLALFTLYAGWEAAGAYGIYRAMQASGSGPPLPSTVQQRVSQLQAEIPSAQQGRITMAVARGEDASGRAVTLIGSSEKGQYIRPGVTINTGEVVVPGSGHAEVKIVNYAAEKGIVLRGNIGATRPICNNCARCIAGGSNAIPVTPLKPWRTKR